jgi:fluoride exporter
MAANLLFIALGGAAGSVMRYLLQQALNEDRFPFGTLVVNVLGCFLIGILWALTANNLLREQGRLLLATGFCGGFTTFSAFSYEGNRLLADGKIFVFFLYTSASVVAGLMATYGGYKLFAK